MNITIVGGGFAGVKSALELAKDKNNTIILISDKSDFQYFPALYSSATGHSRHESWIPLGQIFGSHPNIYVYIDSIKSIDAGSKTLTGESGAVYNYETVIFAIGVVTSYFGIPGLDTYTYGIKSASEINRLKQRLYEDVAERSELDRNYVIVGAGPTGVELSAALGYYIKRLSRRYHLKYRTVNIHLIEAAPRVLPRSSEQASRIVQHRLEQLGVKVQTSKRVEGADGDSLMVSGRKIASKTVIWTSGVSNHPFFAKHPGVFKLAPNGRVIVDEYLAAARDIYVIGDNAATTYTGLAETAVHNAISLAKNLKRVDRGRQPKPYKPFLPATAVPVGRNWAVVEWRWVRLYGLVGAMVRRVADLIGYHDVMPLGMALRAWSSADSLENDYYTPSLSRRDVNASRRARDESVI